MSENRSDSNDTRECEYTRYRSKRKKRQHRVKERGQKYNHDIFTGHCNDKKQYCRKTSEVLTSLLREKESRKNREVVSIKTPPLAFNFTRPVKMFSSRRCHQCLSSNLACGLLWRPRYANGLNESQDPKDTPQAF